MIGQLARQIHSCEMQRILHLIVTTKGMPGRGYQVTKDEAGRLADEIAYCFDAIKEEIKLLSPEERVKLRYPRIPHHWPDIVIHSGPPEDLSPEKKTKWCRDAALKQFKEEHYMLLPFLGFNCEEFDAVKTTEKAVDNLVQTMAENHPVLDKRCDQFDYSTLGNVLSEDFRLYYDEYEMVEDFEEETGETVQHVESVPHIEVTDQQKAKLRIIEGIRTIFHHAIRLASDCSPKSLELWQKAQVIFETCDGDFHSYSVETDDVAEADLRNFLSLFREARQNLWADWVRKERKDIVEKPILTNPQGSAMDALQKEMHKGRIVSENTLYYASEGEMGVGPTDARRKTLIRQQMTEQGATLVRDKGLTAGQAAKKMIAMHGGKKFAYTSDEETNLTREITRYCQENGIRLPNART